MANSCVAYNCQNRFKKDSTISYAENGLSPRSGEHFTKDDYLFTDSKKLKDGAIPSIFNFPSHLHNNSLKRKQPSTRVCVPSERKLH